MSRGSLASSAAAALALTMAVTTLASAQSQRTLEARRRAPFVDAVDDGIARANGRDSDLHLAPPPLMPEQWAASRGLSEVFLRFFGGLAPNATGIERPNADERPIDDLDAPAAPRLFYVLMGTANDHTLTPLHFYQQFDGILALRVDLLSHEDGSPFRVALFGSPLYGSVSTLTIHNGVHDPEERPLSVVLGGAVGLDVWYETRLVQFRGRAWAMPGLDVLHEGRAGVETTESLQFKWRIATALDWDPTWPMDLGVVLLHVERGDARAAVYDWNGDFRRASELRDVWQITTYLELHIN